jgi:hypothetical protein
MLCAFYHNKKEGKYSKFMDLVKNDIWYIICSVNNLMCSLWREDYEKPVRTGHKQGEMQLNCFS